MAWLCIYSGRKSFFLQPPAPQISNPYFFPSFFWPKFCIIACEIGILIVPILLAADFCAYDGVFAYILIENAFVHCIFYISQLFFLKSKFYFQGRPLFLPCFLKQGRRLPEYTPLFLVLSSSSVYFGAFQLFGFF